MVTMSNTATKTGAAKLLEAEERLAEILKQNEELKAMLKANQPKEVDPNLMELGVTGFRAPLTNGKNDKGSKGGSLMIKLGKQQVFPSKSMFRAIVKNAVEIEKFVVANDATILR